MKLTKGQTAEFNNIAKHQPVDAGDTLSHDTAQELIDLGLACRYDGKYCLSEKGKQYQLDAAKRVASRSVVSGYGGEGAHCS